jgi:hypothetical protein
MSAMSAWFHFDPFTWVLIAALSWFIRGKFAAIDRHVNDSDAHWTANERQQLAETMNWIQTDIRHRNGG